MAFKNPFLNQIKIPDRKTNLNAAALTVAGTNTIPFNAERTMPPVTVAYKLKAKKKDNTIFYVIGFALLAFLIYKTV